MAGAEPPEPAAEPHATDAAAVPGVPSTYRAGPSAHYGESAAEVLAHVAGADERRGDSSARRGGRHCMSTKSEVKRIAIPKLITPYIWPVTPRHAEQLLR